MHRTQGASEYAPRAERTGEVQLKAFLLQNFCLRVTSDSCQVTGGDELVDSIAAR